MSTKSSVTREDHSTGDDILTYLATTGEEVQGIVLADSEAAELIGQKVMASSLPVTMASDQADINVSLDSEVVSVDATGQGDVPVDATGSGDLPITLDGEGVSVIGDTAIIEITMSLATSIYADGDVLAATQAIAGAMRENGGHGILQSFTVLDKDHQGIAMDVVFLKTNVSMGTERSAVSITDGDAEEILGTVSVQTSDYVDLVASQHATKKGQGLGVVSDSGSPDLYVALITRGGTPTHSASGITMQFCFFRDGA